MNTLSSFAERLSGAFWSRALESTRVPLASLGVFRWIYGLFLLIFLAPFSAWIDQAPRAFFSPPALSLSYLAPGFPPAPTMLIFDIVALVALCSMTIGYRTTFSTLTLAVVSLVEAHFRYSFGKIDHEFLSIMILVCMALAGWGKTCSVDALLRPGDATENPRWLSFFALMISVAMLSAGLPKAARWIDFDLSTSGALTWFMSGYFNHGKMQLLAPLMKYVSPLMHEIGDYAVPLFELAGLPALLYSRRAWLGWLFCACGFHLGVALFLNIDFKGNVPLYCVFVNAAGLAPFFTKRWMGVLGTVAVAVTATHVVLRLMGGGSNLWLVSDRPLALALDLYSAIPVCLAGCLLLAREWLRTEPLEENWVDAGRGAAIRKAA